MGYVAIMENKMETSIGFRYIYIYVYTYIGYVGIMENKMEITTTFASGFNTYTGLLGEGTSKGVPRGTSTLKRERYLYVKYKILFMSTLLA